MGASVDTLRRRRRQELQIPDDYPYSTITDAELDEIVREIKRAHFKARARVRESLHRVDPEGVIQRWQPLIPQRQYHVSGPNALWHLDGNHKLIHGLSHSWRIVRTIELQLS